MLRASFSSKGRFCELANETKISASTRFRYPTCAPPCGNGTHAYLIFVFFRFTSVFTLGTVSFPRSILPLTSVLLLWWLTSTLGSFSSHFSQLREFFSDYSNDFSTGPPELFNFLCVFDNLLSRAFESLKCRLYAF